MPENKSEQIALNVAISSSSSFGKFTSTMARKTICSSDKFWTLADFNDADVNIIDFIVRIPEIDR